MMNKRATGIVERYFLALLAALGAASTFVFFGFSGLVGYSYPGIEQSNALLTYNLFVAVSLSVLFVRSVVVSPYLLTAERMVFFIFLFLLSSHLVWYLFDPVQTTLIPRNLILFFAEAIPGAVAGFLVIRKKLWREFAVVMILFAVIFLAAAIRENLLPLFSSGQLVRGVGGHQYQVTSYFAAFAAGLLVAGWQFLDRLGFPYLIRVLLSTPLVFVLVAIALAIVLANGGRGAFLLFVIYVAFACVALVRQHLSISRLKLRKFHLRAVALLLLPASLLVALPFLVQIEEFHRGLERAVAYIDLSGERVINLEDGSSGRDRVYARNFEVISNSPFVGYGPFDHWDTAGRPHNFFFEIVIQFGIPLAMLIILMIIVFLIHVWRVRHEYKLFVLFIGLFPLINLQFSTTYLWHSVFWFCLAALMAMPSTKIKFNRHRSIP